MYVPDYFKESDPERLAVLINGNSFGMLVTAPEGVPFVTHLPFLFERSGHSQGRLLGHMARANPQWQHFSSGSEVVAIFQGPHAYISPSWYASPGVPTWNYAVAHLRGIARLIENESALATLVERLTQVHESHMSSPWQPDFSSERHAKMLNVIVGFEIEITDIQGKFKLSQNRSLEDRQRVIKELNQSGNQTETAVAALMSASQLN